MFGDAVAMNVSNLGIPVLMLDTEMSKEDHLNRMLANVSGVDINKISTGKFTENPLENKEFNNGNLSKLSTSFVCFRKFCICTIYVQSPVYI